MEGAAGSRTQSAFTSLAAVPFDAEGIGLRASVSSDPQRRDAALVNLQIEARDIVLAQDGDRYAGHLRIQSVGYLPNGLIAPAPITPLDIDYSAEERDRALRDGIAIDEKLAASQGRPGFA